MDLISRDNIIAEIRDHARRVGTDNDLYQLAHDHIIRIIQRAPAVAIADSESFLSGYKITKDYILNR